MVDFEIIKVELPDDLVDLDVAIPKSFRSAKIPPHEGGRYLAVYRKKSGKIGLESRYYSAKYGWEHYAGSCGDEVIAWADEPQIVRYDEHE